MLGALLVTAAALAPQEPAPEVAPEGAPSVQVQREFLAMGTRLRARVRAPSRAEGLAVLEEVRRSVGRMDGLLSTWRSDTPLARLNAAPVDRAVPLSDELVSLLREARAWSRRTDGAFDPVTGSLVKAWGLRDRGRRPSEAELERALAASGFGVLSLDPEARTATRRREGVRVDAGGFGKGVALRRARRVLRSWGVTEAYLSFGGQVLALGGGEDGRGWEVPVAHPARRDRTVALLRISGRSVATSGASERFVRVRGEIVGHVLDPRTGAPVPPWGSVTVVAEDAVAADVLSTALFVLGPEDALHWAEGREEYGVLLLERTAEGLEARWNRAMERWLVQTPITRQTHDPGG